MVLWSIDSSGAKYKYKQNNVFLSLDNYSLLSAGLLHKIPEKYNRVCKYFPKALSVQRF